MSAQSGIFTISLDFELHWGIFDNVPIAGKEAYFDNTIKLIPDLLERFSSHGIQATWATVGLLFNKNFDQLKRNYPEQLPSYINSKFSAYNFIETELDKNNEKYYLAADLISQIQNTPGQEIATHTYAHYYTLEKGQTIDEFEEDIKKAVTLAQASGIALKSIVFPRNQINYCLLYTSPSPRDLSTSRMPSSA